MLCECSFFTIIFNTRSMLVRKVFFLIVSWYCKLVAWTFMLTYTCTSSRIQGSYKGSNTMSFVPKHIIVLCLTRFSCCCFVVFFKWIFAKQMTLYYSYIHGIAFFVSSIVYTPFNFNRWHLVKKRKNYDTTFFLSLSLGLPKMMTFYHHHSVLHTKFPPQKGSRCVKRYKQLEKHQTCLYWSTQNKILRLLLFCSLDPKRIMTIYPLGDAT